MNLGVFGFGWFCRVDFSGVCVVVEFFFSFWGGDSRFFFILGREKFRMRVFFYFIGIRMFFYFGFLKVGFSVFLLYMRN